MAKNERKETKQSASAPSEQPQQQAATNPTTNPTQETTTQGPTIEQVIQESRATIQAELSNPGKRKYKPRQPKATTGPAPEIRKPLDPEEVKALAGLLTPVISMPYEMAAQRSGVAELRCSPDELALQSDALAKVMIILAPKMGEKEAAIFGALVAVGGVAMSKVTIYQDAKARAHGRPVVVAGGN